MLQPVDFPVLIELNGGLDIDMLFGFILRIVRVKIAAELLDALLDIKNCRQRDRR
jgi:hypothetical protein